MKVKFQKLHPDAIIPKYAKHGDAGLDLTAVSMEIHFEQADGIQFVNYSYDTGLAVEIPEGYVGLVFPRSSICKTTLLLTNAVGIIDSGYRGSIKAVFKSVHTDDNVKYVKYYGVGDRICQLVIIPYPQIEPEQAEYLSSTERNDAGYGSTGK